MFHDQPAAPRNGLRRRPSWGDRLSELAGFIEEYGRFLHDYIREESHLYSFLQHQRELHRAGKLSMARRNMLIGGDAWLANAPESRTIKQWDLRIAQVIAFIRSAGGFPPYRPAEDGIEWTLAVWIAEITPAAGSHETRQGTEVEPSPTRMGRTCRSASQGPRQLARVQVRVNQRARLIWILASFETRGEVSRQNCSSSMTFSRAARTSR